jgi:hypothetical protein
MAFPRILWIWLSVMVLALASAPAGSAGDLSSPEGVLRTLVQANIDKDMATMARLIAHDEDAVSYSIEGRKYVGWNDVAQEMQNEFDSVTRLEIPITQLKVWTNGDIAWFAMELDYIRYVGSGQEQARMVLPLRETGILERRKGQWTLVSFHESFRSEAAIMPGSSQAFPPLK